MHRRQLPIAEPCGNDWRQMKGTASVRFCSACAKNVYNLSMLTERAAKAALAVPPDSICVRYDVDTNGSIVFASEPSAARRIFPHQQAIAALAFSTIAACVEPMTDQAAAPVATVAPPVSRANEPTQTPIADPVVPSPGRAAADNRGTSCAPIRGRLQTQHESFMGLISPPERPQSERPSGEDTFDGLTATQVFHAVKPVQDAVKLSCAGTERVLADLTVEGRSGTVTSVHVLDVDQATAACVEEQARKARFPKVDAKTFTLRFPFGLRKP